MGVLVGGIGGVVVVLVGMVYCVDEFQELFEVVDIDYVNVICQVKGWVINVLVECISEYCFDVVEVVEWWVN